MTAIDARIAAMLGTRVLAIDDRQRSIRGRLVARESEWGVVEITHRSYRVRRRIHLRFMHGDWP